jgi:hypothetical protein
MLDLIVYSSEYGDVVQNINTNCKLEYSILVVIYVYSIRWSSWYININVWIFYNVKQSSLFIIQSYIKFTIRLYYYH